MDINFKTFYQNIQLTSTQKEDAKCKYSRVAETLHNHYYSDTKYTGETKFLFGSYAKGTHIRPARDIDMMFKIPDDTWQQYVDNQSNSQAQLLQDVKKVLEKTYPNTKIKTDRMIVVVEFSEGDHNVEVVPSRESDDGTFCVPDSANGGNWKTVDPRKEIAEIRSSEERTHRTRFLIRIVKKWSEHSNAQKIISSYNIERVVLDFLFTYHNPPEKQKSELVRDFFLFAHNGVVKEDLQSRLSTAYKRSEKALEFEKERNLEKASEEWRKIFGGDFPKSTNNDKKGTPDFPPGPVSINATTATPPYHNKSGKQSGKYQLTEGDLRYIQDRYVLTPDDKSYFARKNSGEVLKQNYLYINLPFDREYDGKRIQSRYRVKIDFNCMEGEVLPYVFDIDRRIQKVAKRNNLSLEDMHVYESDDRLCLTLPQFAVEKKMPDGFGVKSFFEGVLEEVLYWHAHYEKYDCAPWKALQHGYFGEMLAMTQYGLKRGSGKMPGWKDIFNKRYWKQKRANKKRRNKTHKRKR